MVATNVAKLYSQRILIYENIKNASFLIAVIIVTTKEEYPEQIESINITCGFY